MTEPSGTSCQSRHVEAMNCLQRLAKTVETLEDLVNKIQAGETASLPEVLKEPGPPVPSLSQFLSELPQEIISCKERIDMGVATLREILF